MNMINKNDIKTKVENQENKKNIKTKVKKKRVI
jgi:hypothetical protein